MIPMDRDGATRGGSEPVRRATTRWSQADATIAT